MKIRFPENSISKNDFVIDLENQFQLLNIEIKYIDVDFVLDNESPSIKITFKNNAQLLMPDSKKHCFIQYSNGDFIMFRLNEYGIFDLSNDKVLFIRHHDGKFFELL